MEEEQQIGISDIVAIFRRRFWWILIPALLGPAVAIGLTFVLSPVYTSKALVFIEQPKVPDKFVPQVVTDQLNTRLITLKEQILSRSRLEPIIQRLGLYKDTSRMEDKVQSLRKAIDVKMITPGGIILYPPVSTFPPKPIPLGPHSKSALRFYRCSWRRM